MAEESRAGLTDIGIAGATRRFRGWCLPNLLISELTRIRESFIIAHHLCERSCAVKLKTAAVRGRAERVRREGKEGLQETVLY